MYPQYRASSIGGTCCHFYNDCKWCWHCHHRQWAWPYQRHNHSKYLCPSDCNGQGQSGRNMRRNFLQSWPENQEKTRSRLRAYFKIFTSHGKPHQMRLYGISQQWTPVSQELGEKCLKKFVFPEWQNTQKQRCPQIVPTVIITVNLHAEKVRKTRISFRNPG